MTDVPKQVIADPKTHYGSGPAATRDFRLQRLTAAFNVVFLLVLVWFVVSSAGADRAAMVATMRNPIVAILLALMVVNVPLHMRIGMLEIIEDYVHAPGANRLAVLANTAFSILIGLVGLVSIIKVFFWG